MSTPTERVTDGPQRMSFADGKVVGEIDAKQGQFISIYEWSSLNPGNRNTIKALKELRSKYNAPIIIHDAGMPGSSSLSYWQKMRERGLVDTLLDDHGDEIKSLDKSVKFDKCGTSVI